MCVLFTVAAPPRALADEPWLVAIEGAAAMPLTAPQTDVFGPGGAVSLGVSRPIAPWLLTGVHVRAGLLSDAGAPADPTWADPGMGSLTTISLAARLRLPTGDVRRAVGPWVEGGAGGSLTGDLVRPSVEGAIGWGFDAGDMRVGPVLRYTQVLAVTGQLDARDARVAMAGVEVVLFDAQPAEAPAPVARAGDRDHDGILDPDDACPSEPEDRDGFQDADGCPETDNDRDGVPDVADACPLVPEDHDAWQDEDGCPDPDNDGDGFLDPQDRCPNEAEVVNGVEDEDGCPDEGVIQMIDDRIILEERVLFDFQRARVKRGARAVIQAIVTLCRQHPEWTQLRVEGHSDRRGVVDYNQRLSERRAAHVLDVLVRRGVPAQIIESAGYGATHLRDTGTTEAAHQRNRRVEFVVVSRGAQ